MRATLTVQADAGELEQLVAQLAAEQPLTVVRATAGLNTGERRNMLAWALSFNQQGTFHSCDRSG